MRVWILILVVGCNSIYGLDGTRVRGPDLDGDGLVEDDNCPALANVDQLDADDDGVGDVCDPCIMGMQLYTDADHDGVDDGCDACTRGAGDHDEDGDTMLDACDNCPAIVNDQLDADADGIGDACDLYATKQHRVAFVGFDTVPFTWIANKDTWTVANDTVGPASTPTMGMGVNDGLWNRTDGITGAAWSFETAVTLPSPPPSNYTVGIGLRSRDGGILGAICSISSAGAMWRLATGANGALSADFTPTSTSVRLRIVRASGSDVRCEIVDGASLTTGISVTNIAYTPVLFTNKNAAAFHYAELVE